MVRPPQPKGGQVFFDFRELAAHLEKQLKAVEVKHIGPAESPDPVAGKMNVHLGETHRQLRVPNYGAASEEAWKILGLAGLTEAEFIKGESPPLDANMPAERKRYVASALTVIGLLYRNQRNHLAAVWSFEQASLLEPRNIFALRNLSDLCSQASPELLKGQVEHVPSEINREVDLGIWAAGGILKALGVTGKQLDGGRIGDEFKSGRNLVDGTWALNNAAYLLYRKGRFHYFNQKDFAAAEKTLGDSIRHAQTSLAVLGLPRDLSGDPAAILERVHSLGPQEDTAVHALSLLGLGFHMLGNVKNVTDIRDSKRQFVMALRAFKLAREAMPERDDTKNQLELLLQEQTWLRSYREEAEHPAEEAVVRKPEFREPAKQWEDVRAQTPPSIVPEVALTQKLSQCALGDVRVEAGNLVHDIGIVMSDQGLADEYLNDAYARQDVWWAGLTPENLPAFVRAEATLTRIMREGRYSALAGKAREVAGVYGNIRESVLTPELEEDYKVISRFYAGLAEKTA